MTIVLLLLGLPGCDALIVREAECGRGLPCPRGQRCAEGTCVLDGRSPCWADDAGAGDAAVGGACVPPATGEGLVIEGRSACQQGIWQCDADAGGLVCEGFVGPEGAETCDGRDEDCDGMVDEETSPGVPCLEGEAGTLPEGMMNNPPCQAGVLRCIGGVVACDGLVVPADVDRCDGVDDDCDGAMDEDDRGRVCEPDDTGGMAGELCPTGNVVCERVGGEFIAVCRAAARGEERCDDLDNDCDMVVDEPFLPAELGEMGLGEPCEVGVGVCRRTGVYVCNEAGDGTKCSAEEGEPEERGELCGDGLDNDCNGGIDEGFVAPAPRAVGTDCMVGLGRCQQTGQYVCSDDRLGVECSAAPRPAVAEVCDEPHVATADDDCDGRVDEGCACNPRAPGAGGPVILTPQVPQGRGYELPDPDGAAVDPGGLGASCTGQAPGAPRDEMGLVWQPRPGLVRVEVASDDFDPRAYVAPLCRMVAEPPGLEGERACGLDAGLSLAVGDGQEGRGARAASMVVRVPDPAPGEVGVFVEATPPGAVAGEYRVEISDPTGVAACRKVLAFGEGEMREVSGETLCHKRLTNALIGPPGAMGFTVLAPDEALPAPFDGAGRWDEPRFCVDNDGRARSVEVDWDDVTDEDGVEAVMLPAGAERGDWWSTVVDADAGNFLFVSVEPVGAEVADAPCLANSVRVVAWLSCTTARAQEMVADNCGAVGNATLVCDPQVPLAPSCIDSDNDGSADRWARQLTLGNLVDEGCRRAAGSQLVLHIGVIRDDNPTAAPGPCSPCSNVTIPPGDCFRYRLRVRRP